MALMKTYSPSELQDHNTNKSYDTRNNSQRVEIMSIEI